MDFAYPLPQWAFAIHVANTASALLTLVPAVYYAVVIKHHLIYLTPLLAIALAYENLLLVLPIRYQTSSAQETGWVMNALIPPLFLVICFETGYVIHKERSVKYLGINFDEGKRVDTTPCSWFLRYIVGLVAVFILAVTLLVNFARFFSHPSARAGMAGYIALGSPDTAHFYISLVPSYVLSIVTIFIGAQIKRYGTHSTLLIRQSYGWNLMLFGAVIQCAGQFPAQMDIYPVTSMLGQTIFLMCTVLTHREVYRDLTEADKISDFLRRQTLAAQRLAQQPKPTRRSHHHGHHHGHHHHHMHRGSSLGQAGPDGKPLVLEEEAVSDPGQVLIEMVSPARSPFLESEPSKRSEDGGTGGEDEDLPPPIDGTKEDTGGGGVPAASV